MSHRSASGFGFSILVEIAAVIAIVSFLPRIDLRPKAQAAIAEASYERPTNVSFAAPTFIPPAAPTASAPTNTDIAPVGWTPVDLKNGAATRPASYSEAPITIPRSSSPGSFSTNDFSTNNAPPSATSFYAPQTYTAQAPLTQSQSMPPIITTSPDPKYVENRLDRASQRLVNSLGSSFTSAANSILPPTTTTKRPAITNRRTPTEPTAQHRPWLRY